MKKLFQFGGLALALLVCCTSLGATPPVHARDVGYVRSAAVQAAFFNWALWTAPDLRSAFSAARALVTAREKRDGFEPSNPQMAGGSEVLALLARR